MAIYTILSSKSRDEKELVEVPNYPNWLIFANISLSIHNYPRVITYVNTRLSSFWFSLCKDILNHRDILLISFFINNNIFFLINIYSNSLQSALKYLKDTEVDIPNVLIMVGNFNIRDNFWDPMYLHHSTYSDLLINIMNSLLLGLSYSTNSIPTKYLDDNQSLNLVINLVMVHLDTNIFSFSFIYFSGFYISFLLIFFFFFLLFDDEVAHDRSYMTGHMMWCHKGLKWTRAGESSLDG